MITLIDIDIMIIKIIFLVLLSMLSGFMIAQTLFFRKIGKFLKEIDKEQIDCFEDLDFENLDIKDSEIKFKRKSNIRIGKLLIIKELLKKRIIH